MDESKHFRLLWRANAVLFLLALVLAIGRGVYRECRSWFREPDIYSNASQWGIDERGERVVLGKWRYGDPRPVPGGAGFLVPLHSTWSADEPSRRSWSLRNLLFLDSDLGTTRWLLPDNEREISSWEFIKTDGSPDDKPVDDAALGILLEVPDGRADAGEREDETRRLSLYLARPDATGLARVLDGVTRFIGHELGDGKHLVSFYVKDGAGHAARIALADFSVVESVALALPK